MSQVACTEGSDWTEDGISALGAVSVITANVMGVTTTHAQFELLTVGMSESKKAECWCGKDRINHHMLLNNKPMRGAGPMLVTWSKHSSPQMVHLIQNLQTSDLQRVKG